MKVLKESSFFLYLARLVFLLLPTMMVVLFILWNSTQYFTFLREQWQVQTLYFSAGMFIAHTTHQFRFRFLPIFLLIVFALFSIYKLLDSYTTGEFDSFFISVQFFVFAYLFSAGYLVGWAMQRLRLFPIIMSAVFLLLSIFLISKTGDITIERLLISFTPIALYSVYIIYTSEALRNIEKSSFNFWMRFSGRLVAFSLLLLLMFGAVVYLMYPEIQERVEEYGGQGKEGENQMLRNKKDGTSQNRESMGLSGNNKRNNNPEPLFCAHINNYFPGSEVPNPLYLTSYHFTKFDTLTETFERDSTNSLSDEFVPDPSSIPLFFTFKDSTRLEKEKATKSKSTVEIEVYKKRLAASAFIAPSTAFFVQPITVEKDFQGEYSTAYRAKSSVSDLNSAYFIYNADDPKLKEFQEQRFQVLRKAKPHAILDQKFLDYYTFFPTNGQYAPIKKLADSLAIDKNTDLDKVLSVRDYFLQRNAIGEKVFSYSDNPGIPGLPGASKLLYFLFDSKKGYCAYYAAATVAILRSMDVPCRVVTGFLTVDRSDKNQGWYWFYEDQSHGWVQVYFPEYGWIDFDTTVGNDEAEQSPTPDRTPPMQPPKPVLALSAKVLDIDTLKKIASLRISNMLFKDEEYAQINEDAIVNLKIARIWKDSIIVPFDLLQKGSDVMAVSYAEKLKAYSPEKTVKLLLKKLPTEIPIDEVYIRDLKKEKAKDKPEEKQVERPLTSYFIASMSILLGLIIFLFFIPSIVYRWYKYKARTATSTSSLSYYTHRAASLLLHMLDVDRKDLTHYKFAKQVVDARFDTQYSDFMILYLKLKYANQSLSELEINQMKQFFKPFEQKIKTSYTWKQRLLDFLNLNTFVNYYSLPDMEDESNKL